MRSTRLPALFAAVLLASVASCVDGGAPASPEGRMEGLRIPISAADLPRGAEAPPTINRIRAVARAVPGGTILGSLVLDVAPGADSWSLEIPIDLGGLPGATVEVTFELITVGASGQETVQFAGRTAPIIVRAGVDAKPVTLPLVRGGLGNLKVTGVTITEPLASVLEGASTTLAATVVTSDPSLAGTVFWSSLDPTATVTGNVATGVLPGTARIVATAGAKADTAVLTVRARPASVRVTPDSQSVVGAGVTVALTGTVLDARGAAIADQPVLWRTTTPTVLEDQAAGRFRSAAPGRGLAEARAAADTTLKATAVVRVLRTPTDVALAKTVSVPSAAEGDTVTFTITATNRGAVVAGGVRVAEELPTGLSLVSTSPSAGTFDAGERSWSVGDLAPGASATLAVRARPIAGTAGSQLTNTARLSGMADQQDADASNDVATAALSVGQRTADLAVAKTAQATGVASGDVAHFTITVTNRGPNVARGVTVAESLPSGLAYLNHASSRGTFDSSSRIWSLTDVAPGATETLMIEARVSGADGTVLRNRARRMGTVGVIDPNPDNDTASAAITVGPVGPKVDLHVLKAVTPATVMEGDTAEFQVIVINHGPIPATGIVVRDTLPTGLIYVDHAASAGAYASWNWSIASLDPGQADTLRVRAIAGAGTGGTVKRNEARRTASVQTDSVQANDYAFADLTVQAPPIQPGPRAFHTVGNVQLVAGTYGTPTTPAISDPNNALSGLAGFTVVTTGTLSTALGGTLEMVGNGDFAYFPPVGLADVVDTISVEVMDPNENTTWARLDLTIDSTLVWFVDNANHLDGLPGLPGSSVRPFGTTAEAESASGPGDVIFIRTGEIEYDDIALKDDQSLIGEGADLIVTVNGTARTLVSAGTRPTLYESDGSTIDLASHVRIVGLNVTGDEYNYGIDGSDIDDVEIRDVAIQNGYKGLVLQNVGGEVSVTNLTIGTMAETAIDLQGPAGHYDFFGLSIPDHTGYGPALAIDGGDAAVEMNLDDQTVSSTAGRPVQIDYFAGSFHVEAGTIEGNGSEGIAILGGSGALTFDAPLVLTNTNGPAFHMTSSGAEVRLDGITILNSGMNAGIVALGGGSLAIVGSDNVVATDSATAVWIQGYDDSGCGEGQCYPLPGTAIGTEGIRFRSVSANAADYGILVDQSVVAQGGAFEVTGNGSPGSGGNLVGSLYAAVELTNVRDVTLQDLSIKASGGAGINAWMVQNLALRRSEILDGEYGSAMGMYNVTGDLELSDLHIRNPNGSGIDSYNDHGALTVSADRIEVEGNTDCDCSYELMYFEGAYGASVDLSVNDSHIHDGDGVGIEAYSDLGGTVDLTVDGTTFDNLHQGIDADAGDQSTLRVNVSGSTFSNLSYGMELYQYGSGNLDYDVSDNTFTGILNNAFYASSGTVNAGATGTHTGTLNRNDYLLGSMYASAVYVAVDGTVHGSVTIDKQRIGVLDEVGTYGSGIGVMVSQSAQLGVALTNNEIRLDGYAEGYAFDVGLGGSLDPAPGICLDFRDNTVTGTFGVFQIYGDGTGAFGMEQLADPSDENGTRAAIFAANPGINPFDDAYTHVAQGTYLPCSGGVPPEPPTY